MNKNRESNNEEKERRSEAKQEGRRKKEERKINRTQNKNLLIFSIVPSYTADKKHSSEDDPHRVLQANLPLLIPSITVS